MNKILVGVAVALALVTSQAAADGIDRGPPPTIAAGPPIYAPSWSGFYIGAGVGGGAVVYDTSIRDDFGTIFSFDGVGGEGVIGTAIVGWDWQLGPKTVLGIFVDYDFSDVSTDARLFDFARASVDFDEAWSVGGKLGWLSSPSTLWYGVAGFTQGRFEASASIDGERLFSEHQTLDGWFAGGGIETRLAASNWTLGLEYRFTQFDSESIFIDDVTRLEVEPSLQTVRATLKYKFNSSGFGWGGWGRGWNNNY